MYNSPIAAPSQVPSSKSSIGCIKVPFNQANELCSELHVENSGGVSRLTRVPDGVTTGHPSSYLPENPFISLDDTPRLDLFIMKELLTPDLNTMSPHLWLVAKQSSDHIAALHEQIVRGRTITITENPELHLVWYDTRVFIKPMPPYLMSFAFWTHYFTGDRLSPERAALARAALGYVRSYFYLIRSKSDFNLAIRSGLLPPGTAWIAFANFICGFGDVRDDQVSERYHFGELRLSRLNIWAKPVLGRWVFYKAHWQYSAYFSRYYGPILFLFGIFSVTLSAMQVGLAAEGSWKAFQVTSAWFSVVTLLSVAIILAFLLGTLSSMLLRELIFALSDLFRRRIGG